MVILLYHLFCALCALLKEGHYLCVYLRSHFIRVRPQILPIFKADISNLIIHPQFGNNIKSDSISLIQIISSSIGTSSKKMLFGTSSPKYKAYLINQLILGTQLILVAEVLCKSK